MSQHRKQRGRATERITAAYWRDHGWPWCEPNGASAAGADLTGTPGLAVEIKARANIALPAFMRQARRNAGAHLLPVLILRLNGQGPATIDDWPVVLRHADLLTLLHDAGYTTGDTWCDDCGQLHDPGNDCPPCEPDPDVFHDLMRDGTPPRRHP